MMILRLNKDHGQLPRGIPRLTIHPNEKNSQGNKKEGDNGAITERLPTK